MNDDHAFDLKDTDSIHEMLAGSGYSDKAIDYYLNRPKMGSLPDANQVSELTGPCGDTMKVYLKLDHGRIEDAKIQVLGCHGARHGQDDRRGPEHQRPGYLSYSGGTPGTETALHPIGCQDVAKSPR